MTIPEPFLDLVSNPATAIEVELGHVAEQARVAPVKAACVRCEAEYVLQHLAQDAVGFRWLVH